MVKTTSDKTLDQVLLDIEKQTNHTLRPLSMAALPFISTIDRGQRACMVKIFSV